MRKFFATMILLAVTVTLSMATGDKYLSGETKLGLFIRSEFDDIDPDRLIEYEQNYEALLIKLREKQKTIKSDALFLKHVFYAVHRKMLGQYEQYVTFSEIFGKEKKYDCVTGTAMFALVLDDLDVAFDIHETDYHVYLIARSNDKEFLFESTDPLSGFAWNPYEIAERRAFVNKESIRINAELALTGLASNDQSAQQASFIDNKVNLRQLAGLHYYNQALKQFNQESYKEAYKMIIIAQGIYPSGRIKNASSYMFAMAFGD